MVQCGAVWCAYGTLSAQLCLLPFMFSIHMFVVFLQPFGGAGQRLDGKKKKVAGKGKAGSGAEAGAVAQATYRRGIPHYDYKVGKLKFFSAKSLEAAMKKKEEEKKAEVGGELIPCATCSLNMNCVCLLPSSVVRVHTV